MGRTEDEVIPGVAGAALKDPVEGTGAVEVAVGPLLCNMALRWMQQPAIPWLLLIAAMRTLAIIQLAPSVWSMKRGLKDQVEVPHMEGATPEVVAPIVAEAAAPTMLRRRSLSSPWQTPASQASSLLPMCSAGNRLICFQQ